MEPYKLTGKRGMQSIGKRMNGSMGKKMDRDKWIDILIFVLLLVIVSTITLVLFYRQTTGSPEWYHSDMKAYILEMQGLDSGYSFPYPVFFKVGAFFHLFMSPELAVAVATMVLNCAAMVAVKLALNHLAYDRLAEHFHHAGFWGGILISAVSISLFFLSMLFPPSGIYLPGIRYRYLGVFTGNPLHNATYMAARPFAVLAFLWYARLLDTYENRSWRENRWDYVCFSLFLLLATMTKPSFTIVLVGAAGLIMVYRLVRSRFRNLYPTVILGLCFIPTFIDLLYQFKGVFVPEEGEEGGIGFCLGAVWRLYCDNIALAVCLAVGFPLLVLALNRRKLREDTLYRFSWQVYLMSFVMAFFLFEKGFREPDFNFSWGYMYGIFFTQLTAVAVLLQRTAAWGQERRTGKLLVVLQWLAYGAHLACGLYYFLTIFRGEMYY